ncbi:RHS repeat domain-containing protein, partial [Asticcacaulis sp. 201]
MKRFLLCVAGLLGIGLSQPALAETIISVTQVSYDGVGRKECVTTRMNSAVFGSLPASACTLGTAGTQGSDRITKTVYDLAGQVTQLVQAYGTTDQRVYSSFAYSPNGKVTDTVDANGNRTHMEYDGFDRLIYYRYPSPTRPSAFNPSTSANAISTAGGYSTTDYEQYGYDNNGNKTSYRRRDGNTILYTYDNLNREIVKDMPGGTADDLYTAYDGLGHIVYKRFVSSSGSGVSYAYDGLGRVNSATDMNGRTLSLGYLSNSARQ